MKPAALAALLALAAAAPAAPARPLLEARVNVFQPGCSRADRDDVLAALKAGSQRLQSACGIRLRLGAVYGLPSDGPWCALPPRAAARSARLKELARAAKRPDPGALALFLLPSGTDPRYSWALVDRSSESACDSPQEARFLDRLGSLFFTDLSAGLSFRRSGVADSPGEISGRRGAGREASPTFFELLLVHEVLHALTQRGHPSGAPRGSVMADHVADLGPALSPDWCACARLSPYVHPSKDRTRP